MLDTQYSVEEGSSVYTEYSNNIMPSTELMASFSRMNLDGVAWYVSAVLPYRASMNAEIANMRHLGSAGGSDLHPDSGRRLRDLQSEKGAAEAEDGDPVSQGYESHPRGA